MTNPSDMLEKIAESLGSKATVRSVFGDPIHVEGAEGVKVVVPVAKVAYGFGGGAGTGRGKHADGEGEGGGGGGGVRAYPAGALEITASGTRFISYNDWSWLLGAVATVVTFALVRRVFRR